MEKEYQNIQKVTTKLRIVKYLNQATISTSIIILYIKNI